MVNQKVAQIVRKALDDENLVVTLDTGEDHEHWDSIAVLEMVLAMEQNEGAKYTPDLVAKIKRVEDLYPPVKCVICDADDTLWDGVIAEGPVGYSVGHAELWNVLTGLQESGILLAIVSKNTEHDVFRGLGNRKDAFVAIQASWHSKPLQIMRIVDELNIGADTVVVIDNNPVERAAIRAVLPEVRVVEANLPGEMAAFLRRYMPGEITEEDRKRSAMYLIAKAREEAAHHAGSFEAFLTGLEMVCEHGPVTEKELPRAEQLCQRVNQFNLTTIRHSAFEIPGFAWTQWFRLRDRFGDYGIVGLILVAQDDAGWEVDTFLISCRALGRGLEDFMANVLVAEARRRGIGVIFAEYRPTERNEPIAGLLEKLGFGEGEVPYLFPEQYVPRETPIRDRT